MRLPRRTMARVRRRVRCAVHRACITGHVYAVAIIRMDKARLRVLREFALGMTADVLWRSGGKLPSEEEKEWEEEQRRMMELDETKQRPHGECF